MEHFVLSISSVCRSSHSKRPKAATILSTPTTGSHGDLELPNLDQIFQLPVSPFGQYQTLIPSQMNKPFKGRAALGVAKVGFIRITGAGPTTKGLKQMPHGARCRYFHRTVQFCSFQRFIDMFHQFSYFHFHRLQGGLHPVARHGPRIARLGAKGVLAPTSRHHVSDISNMSKRVMQSQFVASKCRWNFSEVLVFKFYKAIEEKAGPLAINRTGLFIATLLRKVMHTYHLQQVKAWHKNHHLKGSERV